MMKEALVIGENFKRIRLKHNMTQAQFGEVIGKSQSTVYSYETGAVIPPLDVMLRVVSIFNVSLGTIMGVESALPPITLVRKLFAVYASMPGDYDDEAGE